MGTALYESGQFDKYVICPNPGEPVRAGGTVLYPVTISGATIQGDVQYSALIQNVTIEHKGGISMVFGISVLGTAITVQLQTDAMGNVLSTASTVSTAVNANPLVSPLVSAVALNGGTGIAGISGVIKLSDGIFGSVRPPLQSLTNRTRSLVEKLIYFPIYRYINAYCTSFDGMVRQQIVIKPIFNHFAFKDATLNEIEELQIGVDTYLDIRDVEGMPADYDASTFYYVYLKSDATFQISKTAPDQFLRAKFTDQSYVYLFEFLTDASKQIYQFSRSGKDMYFNRMPTAFSGNIPASPATQTVNLVSYLPPSCKQAKLQMHAFHGDNITGTPITVARTINVRAEGSGSANAQSFTIGPVLQKIGAGTQRIDADYSFEMAAGKLEPDPDAKIIISTDTLPELINVKINVAGYSR